MQPKRKALIEYISGLILASVGMYGIGRATQNQTLTVGIGVLIAVGICVRTVPRLCGFHERKNLLQGTIPRLPYILYTKDRAYTAYFYRIGASFSINVDVRDHAGGLEYMGCADNPAEAQERAQNYLNGLETK